MAVMLRSADHLRDLVTGGRDGTDGDDARSKALIDELEALIGGPKAGHDDPEGDDEDGGMALADFEFTPVAVDWSMMGLADGPAFAEEDGPTVRVTFKPHRDLYAKADEATLLLRDLSALGDATITCDASAVPLLHEIDPEGAYLAFDIALDGDVSEAKVRQVFEFAEWDRDLTVTARSAAMPEIDLDALSGDAGGFSFADLLARLQTEIVADDETPAEADSPSPAPAPEPKPVPEAKPAKESESDGGGKAPAEAPAPVIRVELTRVDKLIDLVGELVTTQTMLAQKVEEAGLPTGSEIVGSLEELDRLTRTLQDSVMAVRAQPVKSVFQRMPCLVREVAAATGKKVAASFGSRPRPSAGCMTL